MQGEYHKYSIPAKELIITLQSERYSSRQIKESLRKKYPKPYKTLKEFRHSKLSNALKENIPFGELFKGEAGLLNLLCEVGFRPSGQHQLDRINPSLGYEPGNIQWLKTNENRARRGSAELVRQLQAQHVCGKSKAYVMLKNPVIRAAYGLDTPNPVGLSPDSFADRFLIAWKEAEGTYSISEVLTQKQRRLIRTLGVQFPSIDLIALIPSIVKNCKGIDAFLRNPRPHILSAIDEQAEQAESAERYRKRVAEQAEQDRLNYERELARQEAVAEANRIKQAELNRERENILEAIANNKYIPDDFLKKHFAVAKEWTPSQDKEYQALDWDYFNLDDDPEIMTSDYATQILNHLLIMRKQKYIIPRA